MNPSRRAALCVGALLFTAFFSFGLGAAAVTGWKKTEVTPVLLVKPGIIDFEPVDGSRIGLHWKKDEIKPVILLKPGIGGFEPLDGISIGNTWKKDAVVPVILVEPLANDFVPLRSLTAVPAPNATPGMQPVVEASAALILSRIDGDFSGWDGETIFKLSNGQIWQQTEFAYSYHYAYSPKVTIVKSSGGYKMSVDGVSGSIGVKQLK